MKRLLLPVALFLVLTAPAAAQEPIQTQELGLYERVVSGLQPVRDFLEDYADLADGEITTASEDIWGAQLLSTETTGQGVTASSPPGEYYPDAPEQIRQAGYTLEGLTSRDISLMSALDFADWLGVTVALPFQIARGLQDLVSLIGPLGFFLSWLFMAALWVGIVYFISFLVSFVSSLLSIGSKVVEVIGLFKP
jgi:hypothetical protein